MPSLAPKTDSLESAYSKIFDWYKRNIGQLEGLSDVSHRTRAIRLVSMLPSPASATRTEMRWIMSEVRSGLLEWGYARDNDGDANGSIAVAALEETGGALSDEERAELGESSPLWAAVNPEARSDNQPEDASDERSGADVSGVQPFDLEPFQLGDAVKSVLLSAAALAANTRKRVRVSTGLALIALADNGRPQASMFWAADFLRRSMEQASRSYAEQRAAYLRSKGIVGEQSPTGDQERQLFMTPRLHTVLNTAAALATRTTGEPSIRGRHLLAALLVNPSEGKSGVSRRLEAVGIDIGQLREQLYKWTIGYGDDDEAWRQILLDAAPAPRRLARFDADDPRGESLLNIDQDVVALATLIAARSVSPPLSIGLFGDWGSGKTFFMRKVKETVAQLSAGERSKTTVLQRDLPFYKHIVQIEFNAWHYAEGNLWASLVEHIFANLHLPEDERLTKVEQMQKRWIEQIGFARQAAKQAEDKQRVAEAKVTAAETEVTTARAEHDRQKKELQRLSAKNVARDFMLAGALQVAKDKLAPLGLEPATSAARDVQAALSEARGVVDNGNALITPLIRAKDKRTRWVHLLVVLIGAPLVALAIGLVLIALGKDNIAQISAWFTGAATLLGSGAAWVRKQARWMSARATDVAAAQQSYNEELSKQQAQTAGDIVRTEQDLAIVRQDLAAAEHHVVESKRAQADAATELARTTSARMLARFIEDRASSVDYRKHLGLLAVVRDDFENLSDFIAEENWKLSPAGTKRPRASALRAPEEAALLKQFETIAEEAADADTRINRIVLYIDDLDRCPPETVVKVLQAVHLLLAFPLFVVVVGVDARWVSGSLKARYRELLRIDDGPDADEISKLFGVARSDDYLEKIFQIPLWLPVMSPADVRRMVRGLSSSRSDSLDKQPASPRANADAIGAQPAPTSRSADVGARSATGASPNVNTVAGEQPAVGQRNGAGSDETRAAAANVESLEIHGRELEFIDLLSPLLGRSPRALKRFVNTYRVIKASLSPAEYRGFLRDNRDVYGDFEAILLLLAVDTGLSKISATVFERILHGSRFDKPEANKGFGEPQPQVDDMNTLVAWLESASLGDANEQAALIGWLREHSNDGRFHNSLPRLATFIPRVAQFSFQAGPMMRRPAE